MPTAVQVSWMHPAELREADDNPREITDERYAALKYAMDSDPSMMEARPIIVDAQRGDVVCGNMRLRAARDLGWDEVPVYTKEFDTPAQRREWMLRDNNGYGDWVPTELAKLVAEHERAGQDLRLLGFSSQELDRPARHRHARHAAPRRHGRRPDHRGLGHRHRLHRRGPAGRAARGVRGTRPEVPRTHGLTHRDCPRCGEQRSILDGACTNRTCNWPDPEPGPISLRRLRAGADAALQRLRAAGSWPPRPR